MSLFRRILKHLANETITPLVSSIGQEIGLSIGKKYGELIHPSKESKENAAKEEEPEDDRTD